MSAKLGGEVLKSVSRTFYLTIRALPRPLREPVGLAYLLARATDTIADTTNAQVAVRQENLRAFRDMIEHGADAKKLLRLREEIVPEDAAERRLIERAGDCLDWLQASSEADRRDIGDVLRIIVRGQESDLLRFGNSAQINSLTTADELDEYTYLVAGCVGEFWNRVCFRKLRNFASLDLPAMEKLGRNFGKGLQLVNVLRDLPADLRADRCYLPAEQLRAAGVMDIQREPQKVRSVVEQWIERAEIYLRDGSRYIAAVRNRRVRFACILPWAIGIRTLEMLRERPVLETAERVKVSRREVRAIIWRAVWQTIIRG